MSTIDTANLIEVKNAIFKVEKQMEVIITDIIKKRKIDFDRTDDYGQRGFPLQVYFDSINIDAVDKFKDLKPLYKEFVELKRKQKILEKEYNSDKFIKNIMRNDVKKNTMYGI